MMPDRSDFDTRLRTWMAEGPATISDHALAATLDALRSTPRERRLLGRLRAPAGNRAAAMVLATVGLAAILLVVVFRPPTDTPIVGPSPSVSPGPSATVVPSPSPAASVEASPPASSTPTPTSSPSPTPTPTLAPTPTLSPSPAGLVLGPLAAGTYTTLSDQPRVTFSVPDGLILRGDGRQTLWLTTGYSPDDPEFDVIRGSDPDTVDRLAADTRITSSEPVEVTVGGLPGRSIDLTFAAGAQPPSVRGEFDPDGVLIALPKAVLGHREELSYIWLMPGARARLIELTVGERQVLVFYQALDADFDDFSVIAEAIVESLAFSE